MVGFFLPLRFIFSFWRLNIFIIFKCSSQFVLRIQACSTENLKNIALIFQIIWIIIIIHSLWDYYYECISYKCECFYTCEGSVFEILMLCVYRSQQLKKQKKNPNPFWIFLALDNWRTFSDSPCWLLPHTVSSLVSCSSGALFPLDLQDKRRYHVYLMLEKQSERMQKCVTIWLLVHLSTGYRGHWDPSECYWYRTLTGSTSAGPRRTEPSALRGALHLQTLELVTNQRKLLAISKCSSPW